MNRALAWLVWTTTRNRLRSQVRRLRSPRYAAALVAGLLYFWWFFFRPGSARGGGSLGLFGPAAAAISPLFIVLILSGVWLFGGDRTALAFSPAEVSMLLTAPVPRRTLIAYKLARAQLAIFISSLMWVFLLRRGSGPLPGLFSALSFWVLFTTLGFHRLGAALVHASSRAHGVPGLRRNGVAIAAFMGVAVVLVAQLAGAREAIAAAGDPGEVARAIGGALSAYPAKAVLYPLHLMLGPLFAGQAAEWARAMLGALAILLAHAWWVLRSEAAFEEAAADASALRATQLEKLRARQAAVPVAAPKSATRSLALAPTGRPATAIVWKNALCLLRTQQLRALLAPVTIAFVAAFAMAGRVGTPAQNVALVATVMAVVLLLFGSRSIRNDLRSDMLHLPMLKTLPLSGTDLVLAEVASGALPMAAAQYALLLVAEATLAIGHASIRVPFALRLGVLVAGPVLLLAINLTMFGIVNAMAVLLPAWTRLGTTGAAGVEAIGSNLIATFGTMLLLVLLLIVPAAAAAGAYVVLASHLALATAVAGVVAGLVLLAEDYGLVRFIGRAFDRAEPQQVT